MPAEEITHHVVADATARFLAAGGEITVLPDTVEEQRAHMKLLERLEGLELGGLDELAGL
jgi:hypothetical protein